MPKGQPGTLTHGLSAYTNGRCKCDVCREAANEWRRARYGHKPLAEYNAEREPEHGTEGRYIHYGCRCAECRRASAEGRRPRRKANLEATRKYDREYKRRRRSAA